MIFLSQITINNPKAVSSSNYLRFASRYVDYLFSIERKKDTALNEKEKGLNKKEDIISKTFTGAVKDFLSAESVYELLTYGNDLEQAKKELDKYAATSETKEFYESLNKVYSLNAKLAPGNMAPEFSFPDLNGKMVSLKDFRGKIVYLDIWASWCGPCRKEIPDAKKLEEEMKGKEVAFLCVSVDANEEPWKKIVKEKEMAGIHLISKGNFDSEICKLYNVRGIPRYVIIDKEGKIVQSDANRPSTNVKEDLEALLKK